MDSLRKKQIARADVPGHTSEAKFKDRYCSCCFDLVQQALHVILFVLFCCRETSNAGYNGVH